jgi:hypothetical protein
MTKSIIEKTADRLEKNKKDTTLAMLTPILYERTNAWGNKYGLYKKDSRELENNKYSKKALQLAKAIDGHSWGGHDSYLREAFEIAIGEKLPPSKKEKTVAITYELGTVVVPLSDPNGHSYTIGEPILITKSDGRGATAIDNCAGKALPNNSSTAIRPATKNEIQQLLEDMLNNKDKSFNTVMASFFLENIK